MPRLFLFAVALSFTPFAAAKDLSSKFLKTGQAYEMLTYEEFRRLPTKLQREYVADLRAMFVELNRTGFTGETAEAGRLRRVLEMFQALGLETGHAASVDCSKAKFSFFPATELRKYPFFGASAMGGKDAISQCPGEFRKWVEANGYQQQVRDEIARPRVMPMNEDTRKSMENAVSGDASSAAKPVVKPAVKPAEEKPAADPRQAVVQKAAPRKVEKVAEASETAELPSDPAKIPVPQSRDQSGDPARYPSRAAADRDGYQKQLVENRERDKKIDQELSRDYTTCVKDGGDEKLCRKDITSNLVCIYGGFVIEKEKDKETRCRHRESFDDKKAKIRYACTKAAGEEAKDLKVVTAEPQDDAKPVLCNPLLFGLNGGKPVCVAKGKDATKNCLAQVEGKDKDQILEEARRMMAANPDEYRKLRGTIEHLCRGTNDADIKTYIHETLGRSEKSAADLAQTCMHFAARFQSYRGATGVEGDGPAGDK